MEQKALQKWVYLLLLAALCAAGGYFFIKHLLPILLPFLLGALLASLVQRPLGGLCGRRRKWASCLLLGGILVLTGGLLLLVGNGVLRLCREGASLLAGLTEGELVALWEESLGRLLQGIPLLGRLLPRGRDAIALLLQSGVSFVAEGLPGVLGSMLSALPGLALGFFVFLYAAFTFAGEGDAIAGRLARRLPEGVRRSLSRWGKDALRRVGGYLGVYLLLSAITFCILFAGFSLMGMKYALLCAAGLALLDLLPFLGVGWGLLPMALIALLGDRKTGLFLLALLGATVLVRQILEPRLVGKRMGVHPLLMLLLLFGLGRLFGFGGLLLAPLCGLVLSAVLSLGEGETGQQKGPTETVGP